MDSLTIILVLNGIFFISFFLLKNIYVSLFFSLLALFILLFASKKKTIPSFRTSLNLSNFTINNSQYLITIACLVVFLVLEKFIGFTGALFATFFIFSYLNKLDSRTSFFIALILLIITALFSIGGRNSIAENVAVMVYYFLVVGVVWQIIELRQDKTPETDAANQNPEEIVIKKFSPGSRLSLNFFTKKNVVIIIVSFFFSLSIFLFFFYYTKSIKESAIISPVDLTITITPKIFKNIPFNVLNATKIRGHAASAAASLRTSGWDKEFDISIGNYDGTASANIVRYTENLTEKIKLLEKDLNIQVTPVIFNEATREAEMILILGK